MRRMVMASFLLSALLGSSSPAANYASRLDGLEAAVRARLGSTGLTLGKVPANVRALVRADRILSRDRGSLADDFRRGRPAARLLETHWSGDPLMGDLDAAVASLREGAAAEREGLAAWTGRTGSGRGEARLERGLAAFDRLVEEGEGKPTRAGRIALWGRACREVRRARAALHLVEPGVGPPPFEGVAPDFSLADVNPQSATTGQAVSPRAYVGKISAWYFTRLT